MPQPGIQCLRSEEPVGQKHALCSRLMKECFLWPPVDQLACESARVLPVGQTPGTNEDRFQGHELSAVNQSLVVERW